MTCHTCQFKRCRSVGNFVMWHCELKLLKVSVNDADWKVGKGLPVKCRGFKA